MKTPTVYLVDGQEFNALDATYYVESVGSDPNEWLSRFINTDNLLIRPSTRGEVNVYKVDRPEIDTIRTNKSIGEVGGARYYARVGEGILKEIVFGSEVKSRIKAAVLDAIAKK